MMRTMIALLAIGFAVAGCQTDKEQSPLPLVTISGPTFAPTAFDCGTRPIEPDLSKAEPSKQGSVSLRYQNALGTWGQRCQNRLTAVEAPLKAAGQVAGQ